MTNITVRVGLMSALLAAALPISSGRAQTTVLQQRAFGTITRGSTVCVGPLSPSDTQGVQIFGSTNADRNLTWQVFRGNANSAPVLVFEQTARFVDQTIPPEGGFLYHACVVKDSGSRGQDFDLQLNSSPIE